MSNTNSIVIDKLLTNDSIEINSAITIMNGTELFQSVEYTQLVKKWQLNEIPNEKFTSQVIEMYVELGKRYGLSLSTEDLTA